MVLWDVILGIKCLIVIRYFYWENKGIELNSYDITDFAYKDHLSVCFLSFYVRLGVRNFEQ